MEMALGMNEEEANSWGWRGTDQGSQMKTDFGWYNGGNGTNSSGFSGLPGGNRAWHGAFLHAGNNGLWWSSSLNGSQATHRGLNFEHEDVDRADNLKQGGSSVRCIQDSEE
jgi:uncharacterized protein (TIGR02145 family)